MNTTKTTFKPMLGCNEAFNLKDLHYPLIGTIKKDGVRGIVRNGELQTRSYVSQSLPLIKNIQIIELAKQLREFTLEHKKVSIDLEIYIHGIPLNEIVMFTNTVDIKNRDHFNKIHSKVRELTKKFQYYLTIPPELELYVFDMVTRGDENVPYLERMFIAYDYFTKFDRVTLTRCSVLTTPQEVEIMYEDSLDKGFEGLVLRSMNSPYKYGRATAKEEYFLKLKPIEEFEGIILELNERKLNMNESMSSSMGYAIKQDNGNTIESGIAATATVLWNEEELKINLTGSEYERVQMWDKKEEYKGKKIIFKGMAYGMKRVPRFPTLIKIIQ